MLFANMCARFISSCYGELWNWHFLGFLASLWCLVHMGSASLASLPAVHRVWVNSVCLLLDTPFGRRSVEHYLCNLWGECLAAQKTACYYSGIHVTVMIWEPYIPASVGQPSLHGPDACMVYRTHGALRRNCRHVQGKPSFSPSRVFLFNRNSRAWFWGLIFWHLWIGRARHLGQAPPSFPFSSFCF